MAERRTLSLGPEPPPRWLYAAFALLGMLAGLALARFGPRSGGGSRIQWPAPEPPHPRSLGL